MKFKLTIHGQEVPSREPKAMAQFANRSLTDNLGRAERSYVSEGIDAYFKGETDRAIEKLMSALNINPRNAEACLYMARVCKMKNAPAIAIGYFDRAVEADPNNSEARIERGLAVLEKRSGLWSDASNALADFSTAFILNSNEVRALYYMGVCKHRMWDYGDALALFERYSELAPIDILAARELEIYREKTRTFGHYSDMSLMHRTFMYS